jgi:succinate dehydrogenase / fumarate reductase cytochrome b subunit
MKRIIGSINDVFLNFNTNTISFAAQRVTGICLVFYLFLHICVLSSVVISGATFDNLIQGIQFPITKVLEVVLIFGVLFHLFNGVRIIVADFFKMTRAQTGMLFWACIFTAIGTGYTILVFLKL